MSELRRPTKPLTPKSFEQWVGRLPLADAGTTAKALNAFFLQLSTEAEINPVQRLGFLEALAKPIDIVMHAFLRHFRDQAFPIPDRVHRLNRSATELLEAVLTQYHIVFHSEASWLSRTFRRSRRAVAAQRWLHYAQQLYYQHALLGLAVPEGFWLQAHGVYGAARESGIAATPVTNLGEAAGETNTEQAYARLILTALAPLQRLDPPDLLELDLPLHAWSRLVELTPGRKDRVKGPFCITLDEDLPPVTCDKHALRGASAGLVYLEVGVEALTRELVRLLKQSGNSQVRWPLGEKEVQLSRNGLQTLYRYWCKPPTRRAARSPERSDCIAAFGLGAVYRLLLQEAGAVAEPEQTPAAGLSIAAAPAAPQTIRRGEMVSHKDVVHSRDVWDSVYHDHTPMRKRHWSEVDLTKVYRPITALIEDSSSSGLCISTAAADLNAVKVGDIVGLKTGESWEAASVCWIAEEGERVRFGLRRVGTHCEPAELDLKPIKGQTAHFSALLATLHDGQRVVIAPRVASLGAGHLVLESESGRRLISGTPLLSSGRFVLLSPEPLRPPPSAASHPKL